MFQAQENDLNNGQIIHVMTLLQDDKNAEMYMDFIWDGLQREWVQEQLVIAGLGWVNM